ncbi:MAG: hypothetical protein K2M97_02055 [Muribaculaceae bacterium]|nr:hypothetical protein [Muribaculaceae bacterium]
MTEETKETIISVLTSGLWAGVLTPIVLRAWKYVRGKIKDYFISKKDRKPKKDE